MSLRLHPELAESIHRQIRYPEPDRRAQLDRAEARLHAMGEHHLAEMIHEGRVFGVERALARIAAGKPAEGGAA